MLEIINEDDINDIAIISIDELVKEKIITDEQGGFKTQDIICDAVKKVLNRKELKVLDND